MGARQWPSTPGLGGQRLYMLFLWFSCFVSEFYVSSEEAKCLICFIGDGVYVESPIQVVLYVNAKVFCCADVLQVVSVYDGIIFFPVALHV